MDPHFIYNLYYSHLKGCYKLINSSYGIGTHSDNELLRVNDNWVNSQRVCIYAHFKGSVSDAKGDAGVEVVDTTVDYVQRSWLNIIGEENWIVQNRTVEFEMTLKTFDSLDLDKSVSTTYVV